MAEEEKQFNPDDVAEQLVEGLGLEVETSREPGVLDEFYKSVDEELGVKEEPKQEVVEQQPEPETEKWVHEPTGREFESEAEYLRYNSGWTADKLGKENAELRERLEKIEQGQQQQPQQKFDEKEVMKQLWPDLDDESLDDPAIKLFYKGLDRTAGILQEQFNQKLESLKEENNQLRAGFEEDRVRSQFGVDRNVEQKLLEKHPGLKALPAKDRMAVMKDLVARDGQAEKASPKLADKIPQPRAEDHVEGSAISGVPDGASDEDAINALEKKLMGMDDDERTSVLGEMFEKSGALDKYQYGY